jgi:hypothetical protein
VAQVVAQLGREVQAARRGCCSRAGRVADADGDQPAEAAREDAIGRPVEITVWWRGALVDVIAIPRELNDAA